MANSDLILWVNQNLEKLLGFDASSVGDISNYMLSINSEEELKTFATELLCGSSEYNNLNSLQKDFVNELIIKWQRFLVPENVIVYKKRHDLSSRPPNKVNNVSLTKPKKNPFDITNHNNKSSLPSSPSKKGKKKTSFVSLYGKDGEVKTNAVMLPGRNLCECQAQKHKLVNNCLKCGRVVCEQEGSGPCLFCGELVCTKEEREVLARKSNKSDKLRNRLEKIPGGGILTKGKEEYNNNITTALDKARAYKERLLNYDRTYAQRTKVIDDESDYYSVDTNVWLSEKEKTYLKKREMEVRERRFGSRLNKKFTIDFAGREVKEDEYEQDILTSEDTQDFSECFYDSQVSENFPDLINPSVKGVLPVFVETELAVSNKITNKNPWKSASLRLQDKQLLAMSDPGMCLSMHQPWASLLICGIKQDEGRSWYSSHRGRLWIAAAAKKPSQDEIAFVEEQHRQFWKLSKQESEMPDMPSSYPVGCLLGCVDVKDVLSQDEYIKSYPHGESGAAFVFLCENPHELTVKFPVKGKHKIWRLDPKIHKAAKGALVY